MRFRFTTLASPAAALALAALAWASAVAGASAQQLLAPVAIEQVAGDALGGFVPGQLIDGSGLSTLPTLENFGDVTTEGGSGNAWVTAGASFPNYFGGSNPGPAFVLDLGGEVSLTHLVIWGYGGSNSEGTDFTLEFSTDGGETFPASPAVAVAASELAGDGSTALPLGGSFVADAVRLTVTANAGVRGFGGVGTGDRVGLGEIRFIGAADGDPGPVIEAPASVGLNPDGSVQTVVVPLHNAGSTNGLNIAGVTVAGTSRDAFDVVSFTPLIGPLGDGNVVVSFNPAGLSGTVAADLVVASDDPLAPTLAIRLSGFLHDPRVMVPTGSIDFGSLPPDGPPVSVQLALGNAGSQRPLDVVASLAGDDAGHFTVTGVPPTVEPLGAAEVAVGFDAAGESGFFAARLTFETNDPAAPSTVINLAAFASATGPEAPLVISEFMASNADSLEDGDGDSSDWIELQNTTGSPLDAGGWFLTDDPSDLTKWEVPGGTVLPARGFLVVFASGKGAGYSDPEGHLHTSFKLSAGGEFLALVRPDGVTVATAFDPAYPRQFTDVSYGAFRSGGTSAELLGPSQPEVLVPEDDSLGDTWTFVGFSPGGGWTTGPGQGVGFDNVGDYAPFIGTDLGGIMAGRNATAYIRLPFEMPSPDRLQSLSLGLRYDDGFVAYLNGTPVASGGNAPAAPTWNSSTGGQNRDEALARELETVDITEHLGALRVGSNVLAIHGLNSSAGSSDFLIDARLTGALPGDGPVVHAYLAAPTPGADNDAAPRNPGPEITGVSHSPAEPAASENLTVLAEASPRLAPVAELTLHYRVGFGPVVPVAMADVGGGRFTATVPSTAYSPGDMVRYYVSASDVNSDASRLPAFLDTVGKSQSAEYFGTVVRDPSVDSQVPVFQWFAPSLSAGHTRQGTRASVYFAGRFYDNVFVRQRGQATNASVSQKFDFNKGDPFYIDDALPSVGEVNINGSGSDPTFIRQPLAFESYRTAGNAGSHSGFWHMRGNGSFDRWGIWIEQVDEDFLDRNGYDTRGDLYKFVQRSNLNPVFYDTATGIEKKTNAGTGNRTIEELVAALNGRDGGDPATSAIDSLDLPQVNNYLAVRSVTMDADDIRKNFYLYHDTRGDRRWRIFPWDKDFTFGVRGDGGPNLDHPFFGEREHLKTNANQWNVLLDVLFGDPLTSRLYLRRLRTLMDDVLQEASVPFDDRYYEARAGELAAEIGGSDRAVLSYLVQRRSRLFGAYPDLIPESQTASPDVAIAAAEPNPASGIQDHEFVRLANAEPTEIDISGWTLGGGVRFEFAPGTVLPRTGDLYVSPDTLAFRSRPDSPTGGERHLVVGPYAGHLSNFGEEIVLRDRAGAVVSTFVTPSDPSDVQRFLRVSEVMYHPAGNPDAEFIELVNTSATATLDLAGVRVSGGVDFVFPEGPLLAPGARVVLVFSVAAFEAEYGVGHGARVAGEFGPGSRLGNGSDTIRLDDASGSTVLEFRYEDDPPWPQGADGGAGHSLVLANPGDDPDDPESWRPSVDPGGNPGASDSDPLAPGADLVGYAFAGSADVALAPADGGESIILTVHQAPGADAVAVTPEWSPGLAGWSPEGFEFLYREPGATRYRLALPGGSALPRAFVRLRVEVR